MSTTTGTAKTSPTYWHSFEVSFAAIETIIVLLYGFVTTYSSTISITSNMNAAGTSAMLNQNFALTYPLYQDVHVMAFIGFALLVAYLRHSGWTQVGVHFLIAVVTLQVYVLFKIWWNAVFNYSWQKYQANQIDYSFFLTADYCVGAVAVSWVALSGRLGPCQMLYVSIIEAFLYALNENIAYNQIHGYDIGGSMTVWTFGGFFALAAGILNQGDKTKLRPQANEPSQYHTNLFALIGTLFLWVFFPSWNGARVGMQFNYGLQFGAQTIRAVINTILAITGSCITTFVLTALFRDGKFDVDHILKATIAGGVIIGASADLCTQPYAAILIGCWGALMSLVLFGLLHDRLKFVDTLGSSYLFLWPGLWGGGISAIYVGWTANTLSTNPQGLFWGGRTANAAGGAQLAITGISAGIGFAAGLGAGLLVKFCKCYRPLDENIYQDTDIWAQDKDELTR